MKEIDFIPDWYRADQKRRRRCHRQYALLGMLLVMLIVWNFVLGHHVRRVRAEAEAVQSIIDTAACKLDETASLQNEISDLGRKAGELESLAPRTKTSAILAELSCIAGDNIILNKLTLGYELIDAPAAVQNGAAGAIVKVSQTGSPAQDNQKSPAAFRTRAVLSGISAVSADAAALIYRLEQSEYFEQVVPVFSGTKKIRDNEVTEFEIRCYVSDYKIL